jgi:hypothetical protein
MLSTIDLLRSFAIHDEFRSLTTRYLKLKSGSQFSFEQALHELS